MSDTQSDFTPHKPSKQELRSKSEPKGSTKAESKDKPQLQKVKKGKPLKIDKKQKPAKGNQKQPKKKKQSKGKEICNGDITELVYDYMSKQNRPYNALNVFDNLHGKIKKPIIEAALNQLAEEEKLSCKEFGKNKVYFLNQNSLNVSKERVDQLAREFNELRQSETELSSEYKSQLDKLRKLTAKKTMNQLQDEIECCELSIEVLEKKKQMLTNVDAEKVDEKEVEQIEKEEGALRKLLNKRRRLTKQCLKTWSQIMEKKVGEVADIMGVQF